MKPTTYCYIFVRYFVEKIILFVFISKISFADIISQQIWCCFHLLVVLHYRLRMTKRNSDWLIRTNFRYLFLEAEFKKNIEIFFINCFIYTHNPLKGFYLLIVKLRIFRQNCQIRRYWTGDKGSPPAKVFEILFFHRLQSKYENVHLYFEQS